MEGVRALAARKVGLKADDAGLLTVIDEHDHPAEIVLAYGEGKENRGDSVIIRPHEADGILDTLLPCRAAIGAKRNAVFIDDDAGFLRAVAVRAITAEDILEPLTLEAG